MRNKINVRAAIRCYTNVLKANNNYKARHISSGICRDCPRTALRMGYFQDDKIVKIRVLRNCWKHHVDAYPPASVGAE